MSQKAVIGRDEQRTLVLSLQWMDADDDVVDHLDGDDGDERAVHEVTRLGADHLVGHHLRSTSQQPGI